MIDKVVEKIKNNEPVFGCHVRGNESMFVELIGLCGYDLIWIDGEHTAITLPILQNHIIACSSAGTAAIYRVPCNNHVLVKPVLEMGIDGIVFPMIRTADEARYAVDACLYPPKGSRGWGPGRAIKYGLMTFDEYIKKADQIWKVMQIEHIDAVNNLDEILKVPGIDAIIVGMSDLSGSVGKLCQYRDPEIISLLDKISEKAHKYNVPLGISMSGASVSSTDKTIEEWVKRGISWIVTNNDMEFVMQGAKGNLVRTKEIFFRTKAAMQNK